MTSESLDSEHLAAAKKWRDEVRRYLQLFAAAFDELHSAVVRQVNKPGQYIRPHHDYPAMSKLDSGFPSFHESGFHQDSSPRDYVSTVRPRGLLGILGGLDLPVLDFPKGAELASFLRTHEIGKRLGRARFVYKDVVSNQPIDQLVGDAVERYLHLYGLNAPIEPKRRDAVIRPLVFGTIWRNLDVRLVVPITMTRFEVDHFSLTETTYIARMPAASGMWLELS